MRTPLIPARLSPLKLAPPLLALLAGTAAAESPAPIRAPLIRAAPAAEAATVLKHLPAGKAELTFNGENASRSWTVSFGRIEAARTSVLQVGLLNAVSALPERSTVRIALNGTVVAAIPATAAEKLAVVPVRIPPGLLVPGPNRVTVSTALAHRVDCSVKATYELWATLDPARTGFVVPREAAAGPRSLDDLAAEPLAEDGTTRIHLRTADDADPADLGEAARLIGALARRAGLSRPIVDVGPDIGHGAGFDVVLAAPMRGGEATRPLRLAATSEGITIGRDAADRLVVTFASADRAEREATLAALAASPAGGAGRGGTPLAGGLRTTLAGLGFAADPFAGRHYMSSIDLDLPADFYPGNDRARLLIDGTHSAALVEGSQLVFRVNGTLVSTLPLAAGRAERLDQEAVELPLRFFHPGRNDLSIEGTTAAAADAQCDMVTMPRDARLTIAGSSTLEFPDFAHLATLPQIPAALAYATAPGGGAVHLYLGGGGRAPMGAGLTVLANMALDRDLGRPVIHLGTPSAGDPPGILVGAADQLPESMVAALRGLTTPLAAAPAPGGGDAGDLEAAARPDIAPMPRQDGLAGRLRAGLSAAGSLLRNRGFFFAADEGTATLATSSSTLLIATVAPDAAAMDVGGGVALPRFVRDPAHWLLVTAPEAGTTETGVARLVANGQWSALAGRAVSLDLRTDVLRSVQPSTVAYVVPSRVVLSDLRPILGGIVSNNIVLSIGVLMALMSVLGVSTHLLVRRSGVK